MSQRLRIPPGYEVAQTGDLATVRGPKGGVRSIPTEQAEGYTWRRWLRGRRTLPNPVPKGCARWLCQLFAERTGAAGNGQRASARYVRCSARAMRYYCAGERDMPHDIATQILEAINSPAVDVTA